MVEERAKTGSASVIATNTNSLFRRSRRARIGAAEGEDSKEPLAKKKKKKKQRCSWHTYTLMNACARKHAKTRAVADGRGAESQNIVIYKSSTSH